MNEVNISSNSSDEIADVAAYLAVTLGPQRMDLDWLLPLTFVYAIIFCTGLIGNACTCLVIASNQYMQTATNCYLFNLAIADMLTLLCAMPLELYTLWHQYPWDLGTVVCEMRAIIPEATAYASILTIVTVSIEQYIAVCHPLRQTGKSKVSLAIRNIVLIWFISLIAATPYGIFTRVNYLLNPKGTPILESAWCGFPFNDPNRSWETLMLCSTFLFFVVPMTLISVLYIRIAVTLCRSKFLYNRPSSATNSEPSASASLYQNPHTSNRDGQRAKMQSRRIVIRMLIAVVIAFFVCWAPFHAQRLLFLYVTLYGTWTEVLRKVNQDLFSLAGYFYYSNSTINPILYSVMSNRFRVAFREKLCAGNPCTCVSCCFCCCWKWVRDKLEKHHVSSMTGDSNPPSSSSKPINPNRPHSSGSNNANKKLQDGFKNSKKATDETVLPTIHRRHSKEHFLAVVASNPESKDSSSLEPSCLQHYNSDPNFSMRTSAYLCKDHAADGLEQELACAFQLDIAKLNDTEENCCSSCNGLFQSKSKLVLYRPLWPSKSSTSGRSSRAQESKL